MIPTNQPDDVTRNKKKKKKRGKKKQIEIKTREEKKTQKEKDMEKRSFYVKFIIKIPSASLFKNNRLLCAVCARLHMTVCVCAQFATTTTCPTNILKFIIVIHETKNC